MEKKYEWFCPHCNRMYEARFSTCPACGRVMIKTEGKEYQTFYGGIKNGKTVRL